MASLDPSNTQLAAAMAAAADNDGPVVMVNLLKFAPDGVANYQRYSKEVLPLMHAVGATLLYAGHASHVVVGDIDRPWWDAIAIIQYPSRTAFLAMATSDDYRRHAHHHRQVALESTHLIATDPWEEPAQ